MQNGQDKRKQKSDKFIIPTDMVDNGILFEMSLINLLRLDILTDILVESKITSYSELNSKMKVGLDSLLKKMQEEKVKFDEEIEKLLKVEKEKRMTEILEKFEPAGSA